MGQIQCGDWWDNLQGFRDAFMHSTIYHKSPDYVGVFFNLRSDDGSYLYLFTDTLYFYYVNDIIFLTLYSILSVFTLCQCLT